MIFLDLTDRMDWSRKFFLRADLVEQISRIRPGNCSAILTTTGKRYECLESPENVILKIEKAKSDPTRCEND